jgi:hypothetical protein
MEFNYILSIVASISLLIGVALAFVALVRWLHIRGFVQTAEQAEGTVKEVIVAGKGSSITVAEFTDRLGQRHEHRGKVGDGHSVGNKIQILYDQHDPGTAKFNHWLELYFAPLVLYVFFAVDTLFLSFVLFILALFL